MRAARLAEPEEEGGRCKKNPQPGAQHWARPGCVGGWWGHTSCAFLPLPESVPPPLLPPEPPALVCLQQSVGICLSVSVHVWCVHVRGV